MYDDALLDELGNNSATMEYLRCALETDNPENVVYAAKVIAMAHDDRETELRHMFDEPPRGKLT